MDLQEKKVDKNLIITASGRLDASWSEFFQEQLLQRIRAGEHHIILDAVALSFLSSMGIRALMVVYKELRAIGGTFLIARSSAMVSETLRKSGLGQWLSDTPLPEVDSAQKHPGADPPPPNLEHFPVNADGDLRLEIVNAWQPWQPVDRQKSREILFSRDIFGLGIGGPGESYEAARDYFGEFIAIHGHVAVQPPDERGRPDCILSEGEFVPSLQCAQALLCRGTPGHLLRFRADDNHPCYAVSSLMEEMFAASGAALIGFIAVGEIEGLVGAALIESPGRLREKTAWDYPEVKNRLHFTGERVAAREMAVVAGVARKNQENRHFDAQDPGPRTPALIPTALPSIHAHIHGAVFPFQPMPNGRIDLWQTAARLFSGAPPRAVLHLVNDDRPGNGLGESALYHGACWFGPVVEGGELL